MKFRKRISLFLAGALGLGVLPAGAQRGASGMDGGPEMKQAILYFEQGKDDEAMDLFMDILVKGDPEQKNLANDYMNRITNRMTRGEESAPPESLPPITPGPERVPMRVPVSAAPAERAAPLELGRRGAASEGRAGTMRKEIELKIGQLRRAAMKSLQAQDQVKLVEANGFALGVGLPSARLFSSKLSYRLPDAEALLRPLGDLAFASGSSVVHVLPQGFLLDESTILDFRRAMAIGAYLTKRGVSPARIKVQLIGARLDVPGALNDFPGIVVVFSPDEPLDLHADRTADVSQGPPISLGVFPETLRASKDEGAVIEFSALEPPDGLASWKFQMLMPVVEGSSEQRVLQEVVGETPVFHQIFWNGRKDFFGDVLPYGRYVCVLRARDLKGRESAMKSEILLGRPAPLPAAERPKPVELGKGAPQRPALGAELRKPSAAPVRAAARFAKRAHRFRIRGIRSRPLPAPASSAPEAAVPAAPAPSPAAPESDLRVGGTVNFTVYFEKGSAGIVPNGEKPLLQVSANLAQYPQAKVSVDGVASRGEPNASSLAEKRASIVSGLLVNQYGIDPGRIQQSFKVVDAEQSKVDIYIIAQ